MYDRDDIATHGDFYRTHKLRNPSFVLFLILVTLGVYILWWFCLVAKDLKKIDTDAPSEVRALYIFVLFPFTLLVVTFILQFSSLPSFILGIVNNWGWTIILFLMLKFIFDLCQTYAKFTKSVGIYWFLGYFFAFVGIVALILGNLYIAPLILIFPMIVPAMQAQFNFWVDRLNLKKKSNAFYF